MLEAIIAIVTIVTLRPRFEMRTRLIHMSLRLILISIITTTTIKLQSPVLVLRLARQRETPLIQKPPLTYLIDSMHKAGSCQNLVTIRS